MCRGAGPSKKTPRFATDSTDCATKPQISVCRPFFLHLVYYAHSEDTDDALGQLQALLDPYTSRGLQSSIIAAPGEFSRGRGLELGAEHVTDENALLFFVDVDMSVFFLIFWLRHVLVQSSIEVELNCSLRFGLSPHRHRAHTARSGRGVEVCTAAVLLPTLILSSSRNGDCDWSSVFFVFCFFIIG